MRGDSRSRLSRRRAELEVEEVDACMVARFAVEQGEQQATHCTQLCCQEFTAGILMCMCHICMYQVAPSSAAVHIILDCLDLGCFVLFRHGFLCFCHLSF